MRIGLVVDSACDLPADWFREHDVTLLPVTVEIGGDTMTDLRDEQDTLRFLHSHIAEGGADAETAPFTVEQIQELFLGRLVKDYDHVFCLTTARTRSAIHENATKASFAILNEYRPIRARAGFDTPFALRVVDSQNVFAGQGVTAVEAVRLIEAGEGAAKIRARLEHLALHTHAYLVAPDLHYLRARTRKRGDRSVSLISATLGSALDIKPILHCNRGETGPVAKVKGLEAAAQRLFAFAAERVRQGLMTPTMCLSYGGDLTEMRLLPGYEDLRGACRDNNIEFHETVMGLTGMVNVGKGALCVGFAAEAHAFA
ncbi:DegV family protein [Cognatiluteimonas lumbrici]|uniref:DegV family protein n=1 Tax=Cognatiluteimonas lumbrici TaxID=2559601 RepID=UPI00112C7475|nr:DegV family protein [Luteimonas lumbrici]